MTGLEGVAGLVVHHESPDTVTETVTDLLGAGVHPVVLIDNSSDDTAQLLKSILPACVVFLRVKNRGYGAAINAGLDLIAREPGVEMVLTATHEVRVDRSSLEVLRQAILTDSLVCAAGPKLTRKIPGGVWDIWSLGGKMTRLGNRPKHITRKERALGERPRAVKWLDGALVMYRRETLERLRFRELYFLYFEEVDLHCRIRQDGGTVVACDQATASQSTKGMPPDLAGRNGVLFQRLNGSSFTVAAWIGYGTLRALTLALLRRRPVGDIQQFISGASAGLRVRLS